MSWQEVFRDTPLNLRGNHHSVSSTADSQQIKSLKEDFHGMVTFCEDLPQCFRITPFLLILGIEKVFVGPIFYFLDQSKLLLQSLVGFLIENFDESMEKKFENSRFYNWPLFYESSLPLTLSHVLFVNFSLFFVFFFLLSSLKGILGFISLISFLSVPFVVNRVGLLEYDVLALFFWGGLSAFFRQIFHFLISIRRDSF